MVSMRRLRSDYFMGSVIAQPYTSDVDTIRRFLAEGRSAWVFEAVRSDGAVAALKAINKSQAYQDRVHIGPGPCGTGSR